MSQGERDSNPKNNTRDNRSKPFHKTTGQSFGVRTVLCHDEFSFGLCVVIVPKACSLLSTFESGKAHNLLSTHESGNRCLI